MKVPAAINCDGYKTSHRKQYSPHTEVVYSTWTPRKSRMEGVDKVVFFGLQYFIKDYLIDSFNDTFFNRPKEEVMDEIKNVMKNYTGDEDVSHWEALYDLGYLPLKISALPEGTLTPIRVPMFTIENTIPEFYWLTNFVETIMSTEIWKPMTSATIAYEYYKVLDKYAEKTCDNKDHLPFQAHDFSYRGMCGTNAGSSSGAGHLLSFQGTDTIPAILWLEQYYNAKNVNGSVGCSIPATEHSVAETNIIEIQEMLEQAKQTGEVSLMQFGFPPFDIVNMLKDSNVDTRMVAEALYFQRLLNVYPNGFFSYVADTYCLWDVCTQILPMFKDQILERDGRVVIRPDSGDPCDIICGLNTNDNYYYDDNLEDYSKVGLYERGKDWVSQGCESSSTWDKCENQEYARQRYKGVIELLWDVFGGTINSKGYKVLDPHIGCIYGDAITLERAEEICRRLESKGFASSNIVLGVGSYTYNMNTRDTFGFALKTTYGVVNGKELLLYKDPITDDGTKKSQKGMVAVVDKSKMGNTYLNKQMFGELGIEYIDELNKATKEGYKEIDMLQPVFEDGKLLKDWTLDEVRANIRGKLLVK